MFTPTGMTSSLARGFCGHSDTEWQVVTYEMTIFDSHAISCMSMVTLGEDICNVTPCQCSLNTWPHKFLLHCEFHQLHRSDAAVTLAVRPLCTCTWTFLFPLPVLHLSQACVHPLTSAEIQYLSEKKKTTKNCLLHSNIHRRQPCVEPNTPEPGSLAMAGPRTAYVSHGQQPIFLPIKT